MALVKTPQKLERERIHALVTAGHALLQERAKEVKEEPSRGNRSIYFNTGHIGIHRVAELATAISTIRIAARRYGATLPALDWTDISKSMNIPYDRANRPAVTAATRLYEKVLSPQEIGLNAGRLTSRGYVFDAAFTMALTDNLTERGFSLREGAEAMNYKLTPQGHQWRLQQLAPFRATEAEKHAQTQAQTADNLTRMKELLIQRRKAAGQEGAALKTDSPNPSR